MPLQVRSGRPSISVVIPTYNDVGRIGDALTSIVRQTLQPREIVVSDDASDDGTERFVGDFAAHHARGVAVRYICHGVRAGNVSTRNDGISASAGDWIANCDSDDFWEPTKLERQLAFLRGWRGCELVVILGTHGYNTNDAKRIMSPAIMGPTCEADYRSLRETGGIFFAIHSSVLFARSDFDAVGGYTDEYGASDELHFFTKMAQRGVFINIAEPLTYYRKRAGSMQVARYWNQRNQLARLSENEHRRVRGQPPLDEAAFRRLQAAEPRRTRVGRWLQGWGMYHYRAGAVALSNDERVRGGAQLALAALLDSHRVRAGVANAIRHRLRGRR